jgi:hypothetical protein
LLRRAWPERQDGFLQVARITPHTPSTLRLASKSCSAGPTTTGCSIRPSPADHLVRQPRHVDEAGGSGDAAVCGQHHQHYPEARKGGLICLDRHPAGRFLCGGSAGAAKGIQDDSPRSA